MYGITKRLFSRVSEENILAVIKGRIESKRLTKPRCRYHWHWSDLFLDSLTTRADELERGFIKYSIT